MSLAELGIGLGLGFVEGAVFAMSGVIAPGFFREQMRLESFTIMKLFLSACGSSMATQSILSYFAPAQFEKSRFYTNQHVPVSRALPGCLVLGVGMYVGASGPTMISSQLGVGVVDMWFGLIGALGGASAFSLVEKTINLSPITKSKPEKKQSIDATLGKRYEEVAMPMGLTLLGAACVLEVLFPHSLEVARLGIPEASVLPSLAGILVGLNQIPTRLITADGKGGSTCVMNIVSTLSGGAISPRHKLSSLRENAFQLLFVYGGAGLGSWYFAPSTPPGGVGPLPSFIGGFLALFGARYAAGCTCGQGISGVSELAPTSLAAAMCIFAGGIATATVHKAVQ